MASIHLMGLLISLLHALYEFVLPGLVFLLPPIALLLLWSRVIVPMLEYRAQEARDRLRHERARREIDRIATEAGRAMHEAVIRHGGFSDPGDTIEGTATELETLIGSAMDTARQWDRS